MSRRRRYSSMDVECTIEGTEITIHFDAAKGEFYAYVNHRKLSSDRFVDIKNQIRRKLKRTRVTIAMPVSLIEYSKVRAITINGIDLDGSLRLTDDADGKRIRADVYRRSDREIVRRMNAEDVKRYRELYDAACAAERERDQFIKLFRIDDLSEAVQAKIEAEADKIAELTEPTGDPRLDAPRKRARRG